MAKKVTGSPDGYCVDTTEYSFPNGQDGHCEIRRLGSKGVQVAPPVHARARILSQAISLAADRGEMSQIKASALRAWITLTAPALEWAHITSTAA